VQGHIYLPVRIRKKFGGKLKLLPNNIAAVLYPENATPQSVIKSLRFLITELELEVEESPNCNAPIRA
jgi:hypothetical protein